MTLHPRLQALPLALLLSVSLPALAQAATLTVTDIAVTGDGGISLTVPTIEAIDSNLDEATIRGLVTPDFAQSVARLATLDAATLRIPEIVVSLDLEGPDGEKWPFVTTYRDLELSGVKDGIADVAALAGIEMSGAPNGTVLNFGAMSTSLLDVGAMLGFYGVAAGDASTAMRPVYQDFALAGGSITSPLMHCTIAPASGDEFRARPLKSTFEDLSRYTADLRAAAAAGQTPPTETVAALVDYYADLFTSFASSSTEFEGFECMTGRRDTPVTISAGPFSIGAMEPGFAPALSLHDLRLTVDNESSMELANLTLKGTDLNGTLDTLVAANGVFDEAWVNHNWHRILPAFEGFTISGFTADMPTQPGSSDRLVAGIDTLDLSLGEHSGGLPTRIAATGRGARISFPEGTVKAYFDRLGLADLDLDFDLASHWDQAAGTISMDKLGLSDSGLGGVNLSGTIVNAGPELFSADAGSANAALAGLAVTDLTIEIDNAGFMPQLIAAAAAEQHTTPEVVRLTMSGLAQAMPLAIFGATADATGLGQALGAFLEGAPHLSITLTATDPSGIGLAELMAAETDPTVLKDKVRITAATSGQPQPFVYPELPAAPGGGAGSDNR